jgi:beta-glucosidase
MSGRDFPEGFLFGAATAAYQVEGGIENDWTAWERAGKTRTPAGRAVDHWNRWELDFELLAQAGLRAYRLSVEWARIEQEQGRFDDAALAQYRRMLERLHQLGIAPMVMLHHFTHPAWFHEKCPWTSPKSIEAFARFTRRVAEELRGLVGWYVTINEPMVLLLGGFADGRMPPGQSDLRLFGRAAGNILRAHVAARAVLREIDPAVPVGIAHNCMALAPLRGWSPIDRTLASSAHALYDFAVPKALTTGELELRIPLLLRHCERIDGAPGSLDFLGINYYSRIHVGAALGRPGMRIAYRDVNGRGLTDLGWERYPEGLAGILKALSAYGLPLWITENGIADDSGAQRNRFLHEHLSAVAEALRSGIDVRGYLHWSLLDNFEWLEGIGPRFGLYRVDFETLERTPTPSVAWLREVARTGQLAEQ